MPTSKVFVPTPELLIGLGPFAVDPIAPDARCYDAADVSWADGYAQEWKGRAWVNPQAQTASAIGVGRWIRRLADYGRGIILVPAKTNLLCWSEVISQRASGVLFLSSPLTLLHLGDDERWYPSLTAAPYALVAFGDEDRNALARAVNTGYCGGALMRPWS